MKRIWMGNLVWEGLREDQVGKDRRGLGAGMGAAEDRQEWRRIFDTDSKYVFV